LGHRHDRWQAKGGRTKKRLVEYHRLFLEICGRGRGGNRGSQARGDEKEIFLAAKWGGSGTVTGGSKIN